MVCRRDMRSLNKKCLWIRYIPVKVWLTMDKLREFWKNCCLHVTRIAFCMLWRFLSNFIFTEHGLSTFEIDLLRKYRILTADGGCCRPYQVYLPAPDWRSTALSYCCPGSSFPCFDLGNAREVADLIARVKILLQELDMCWVILKGWEGQGKTLCFASRWTGNFEDRKKIGIIPDNQYILQT